MFGGIKGESVRELIARLIDETKAYAKAEIAVVKATALSYIAPVKIAAPLIIGAILLLQAALTVLIAAIGMALATWLGVAGGLAVSAILFLIIAGVCVAFAVSRFSKAGE